MELRRTHLPLSPHISLYELRRTGKPQLSERQVIWGVRCHLVRSYVDKETRQGESPTLEGAMGSLRAVHPPILVMFPEGSLGQHTTQPDEIVWPNDIEPFIHAHTTNTAFSHSQPYEGFDVFWSGDVI